MEDTIRSPSSAECPYYGANPDHNQDIRNVEHACVKWPNVNDGKVGHESVTENPVKEVSRAARQNERKPKETRDADTSAAGQVRRKCSKPNPHSDGKDSKTRRLRKPAPDTQKGARIVGQLQFHHSPGKRNRTLLAQDRTRQVLRGLIAPHGAEQHNHQQANS